MAHETRLKHGLKIGTSNGVYVNTILNENDLASNSENALATQKSIKTYVDGKDSAISSRIDSTSNLVLSHVTDLTNPHDVTLEQARSQNNVLAGIIDMGGYRITNAGTPTTNNDLVTKAYVDSITSSGITAHLTDYNNPHQTSLEQARAKNSTLSGNININGYQIDNLGAPSTSTHAATKAYVDSAVQGVKWQAPVRLMSANAPTPVYSTNGVRVLCYPTATSNGDPFYNHRDDIAYTSNGTWQFLTPADGWAVWVENIDQLWVFQGTNGTWIRFGSTLNHSDLQNLSADDHTQYIRADGTRAFTGTVSGVTPTTSGHLATKGYVDTAASGPLTSHLTNYSNPHQTTLEQARTQNNKLAGSINMNSSGTIVNLPYTPTTNNQVVSWAFTRDQLNERIVGIQVTSLNAGATYVIDSFSDTMCKAVVWDYVVQRDSEANLRTGRIMSCWFAPSNECEYAEQCTNSIGNTESEVTFSVDVNGTSNLARLLITINAAGGNNWNVIVKRNPIYVPTVV